MEHLDISLALQSQFDKLYKGTLLYHGTRIKHDSIDLTKCRPDTDFGRGYYLTSIPLQAEQWAKARGQVGFLYEYSVIIPDELRVLFLPQYNVEWLDFISRNRTQPGSVHNEYDIIVGGLADRMKGNNLSNLLSEYMNTKGTAEARQPEILIPKIKPKKGMDQFCFRTERAVSLLRRVRGWELRRLRNGTDWTWRDVL